MVLSPTNGRLSPTRLQRPSPTKRALSSPSQSPELGSHEQESPRVLRTKLTSHASDFQLAERDEQKLDRTRDDPATTATPPSPTRDNLVGLGMGLADELLASVNEGATQTAAAEDQQRRLLALPIELHQTLARMSSQHHLSEYNQLKQRTAMQQFQQGPYPPPIRAVPLQRSQSSPLVGTTAPPPPAALFIRPAAPPAPISVAPSPATTRPAITRSATNWPNIFRPVISLATSVTSTPDRSRSSTPPVGSDLGAGPPSTLTPTLANLAFDSSAPTPLNGDVSPTKDIAEALSDAIKSNMDRKGNAETTSAVKYEATPPPAPVFSAPLPQPPVQASTFPGLLPGMRVINGVAVKTSVSHPMNISALVPPEYLSHFSKWTFGSASSSAVPIKPKEPLVESTSIVSNATDPSSLSSPFIIDRPASDDLWDLIACSFAPARPPPTDDAAVPTASKRELGNFMLSSCPGKKVRMDGAQPKGGRSAICRDVSLDLGKAKAEGVGLVICCLDDSELAFLGAPWTEYSAAATKLGLTVIRIPMVEGFAPSSPAALDAQLDKVIRECTLKGRSVLAHCRGGIGRAGLVACCWMIKMGFVGAGVSSAQAGAADPMRTVERVIEVIRKRRSVKSIETPIQVAFLLAYVSYLQEQATVIKAADL